MRCARSRCTYLWMLHSHQHSERFNANVKSGEATSESWNLESALIKNHYI